MPVVAALLFAGLVLLSVALVDGVSWILCRAGLIYVQCEDCHDLVAKGAAVVDRVLGKIVYICPRCSGRVHGINL